MSPTAPTWVQSQSRFSRAAVRPPIANPAFSAAPLSAPAEVPEMPAISMSSSSSSLSSTPQVKAPCAPPPRSARLILRMGHRLSPCPKYLGGAAAAPPRASEGGPAAVDRDRRPGDLRRGRRAEEDRRPADLLHRGELPRGLALQHHLADRLLAVHVVDLHLLGDLRL